MSRALRYSPPVVNHELIVRPRLLDHLRQRFERKVTAIVAAPGFGKTSLLAQAMTENALAPLGEDYWLTCQRDDVSLSFLAEGLFTAVGMATPVPDDPQAAATAVADTIWSAAPRQLAIILDDAHMITPGSPGASFLSGLVRELPRNGHIVLACRPPGPLAMSRMRVTGEAIVLGEDDMQFRNDEITAFAQSRGVAARLLDDVGGWPALAELTATVGPHAAEGFVWEELLSQLSEQRRDALSLLIAVGGADNEIATAIFGRTVDLDDMLSGLPLIVHARGRWRALHGLWSSAMPQRLPPERVAEARAVAGRILRGRRQYHEAMSLFVDAEAWPDARALIVDVCEVCTPLVSQDVLEVWSRQLPAYVRQKPEGLLLEAMIAEPTNPDSAARILQDAIDGAGDSVEVIYACNNALVQLAFWRSDRPQMKELSDRLTELGRRGHPEAPGWVALLNALLAPTAEQTRVALADPSLVTGRRLNPVQDWLHTHIVLLKLGAAEPAEALARRSLAHDTITMAAVSRSALVESKRMRGLLDDAREMFPDVIADLDPAKVLTSPELVTNAVVLLDVLGRQTQAEDLLVRFRPVIDASPVAWASVAGPVAEAFHLVSAGDEESAADRLLAIAHYPIARSQSIVQVSASALPVLYVLMPSVRPRWDETPPPGHFADLLKVVQSLVELREQSSVKGVRALTPEARGIVLSVLPPPWAAELAAAMVAVGLEEGRGLLEQLGAPARVTLRRHVSDARSPITTTARALLRELPAVPAFTLQLGVLGSLEMWRDGNEIAPPEFRRERVRQLLAYLLTHKRPARTAITADLWPDLDDGAAQRNLRVTLAYLQDAFEPARNELDPPFFIRSNAGALHLHVDEGLDVDAVTFERSLDEAAQLARQGAMSAALERYRGALDLWRGDYFDGLAGHDWLQWERDRLRSRFLVSAIRAGELLLARGDSEPAAAIGARVLATDQWSESAYQLLMAASLSRADLISAQRYQRLCARMLHELGVPPQQRTVALGRQIDAAR